MRLSHLLRPFLLLMACAPGAVAIAADSPLSPLPPSPDYDADLAAAGKRLYFDRRLSGEARLACADCHRPEHAGAEARPLAIGADGVPGRFNTPSVYNSRYLFRQTWNGRYRILEEMIRSHLLAPTIMQAREGALAQLFEQDDSYRDWYRAQPDTTPASVAASRALAEFVSALTTPNARFDRWLRDEIPLEAAELEGYGLFKTLGCISCHNGVNLGGNSFQYLGAVHPLEPRRDATDRFALTSDPFDHNRFRVPSLRNVSLTAPYLHDGSAPDLQVLLRLHAWHNIGLQLSDAEVAAMIAFLDSLNGEPPAILEAQ